MSKLVAIVRLRGNKETRTPVEQALVESHLRRKNNCILLPANEQTRGFLILVKDFVAWGEVEEKVVEKLLLERGSIEGNKKLTNEYLAKNTPYKTIPELAKALCELKLRLKDVKGLKPLFRLGAPRKGMESIKLPYPKGALGDRKANINVLLLKMI